MFVIVPAPDRATNLTEPGQRSIPSPQLTCQVVNCPIKREKPRIEAKYRAWPRGEQSKFASWQSNYAAKRLKALQTGQFSLFGWVGTILANAIADAANREERGMFWHDPVKSHQRSKRSVRDVEPVQLRYIRRAGAPIPAAQGGRLETDFRPLGKGYWPPPVKVFNLFEMHE